VNTIRRTTASILPWHSRTTANLPPRKLRQIGHRALQHVAISLTEAARL
jgi:hypothetical protein